jgi:hypothetical protein
LAGPARRAVILTGAAWPRLPTFTGGITAAPGHRALAPSRNPKFRDRGGSAHSNDSGEGEDGTPNSINPKKIGRVAYLARSELCVRERRDAENRDRDPEGDREGESLLLLVLQPSDRRNMKGGHVDAGQPQAEKEGP